MILPNTASQSFPVNGVPKHGILTLPNNVPTIPDLDTPAAWNYLIGNYYGATSSYLDTDQPFIQEWNAAIDLHGRVFEGVTLCLVTTTDGLPDFPNPTDTEPAPGFESDCGITIAPNNEQCAAVMQVLQHFTNPTIGGSNAKLVFEAGMTASRDGLDLGTNGIKWLAAVTASGMNPLPGTADRMSRILGGMQFSHGFTSTAVSGSTPGETDIQAEGCPTYPNPLCPGLRPDQGFYNVMQDSYLVGTTAGPLFGASPRINYGNWIYKDAPMNFLEIYDGDVIMDFRTWRLHHAPDHRQPRVARQPHGDPAGR